MITEFTKNGRDYEVKEVTRRKQAICKKCQEIIEPKEKALILSGVDLSPIQGYSFNYTIGIFHPKCYEDFKID